MKIIILSLIVFSCSASALGQSVVLNQKYNPDDVKREGPNEKFWMGTVLGLGYAVLPEDTAYRYQYGWPNKWYFGAKYKFRLNGFFSWGINVNYVYEKYRIKQSNNYSFTDTFFSEAHLKHIKERFMFNGGAGELYIRTNFDPKRGEYLGYYLDLGAGLQYGQVSYFTEDKLKDQSSLKKHYSDLTFTNDLQYYGFAKIGLNKYLFGVQYRRSNWFNNGFPEPPRIMVTAEVNIL